MANLTPERVRALLDYDSTSGIFRWKPRERISPHTIAGSPDRHGYIRIYVDNGRFFAHRLAWLYFYGRWPAGEIDHIDGNKANNAITNLRQADRQLNGENLHRANARNKSGFLGVSAAKKQFQARIAVNGQRVYLGLYKTAEEAHAAYLAAKRERHRGCAI